MAQLIRDAEGYLLLEGGSARPVISDPFEAPRSRWELGAERAPGHQVAPVRPRALLGIGRSYRAHAEELGNQAPESPLLFLKAPSSLLDPEAPLAIPTNCGRIDFEGEIAVVLASRMERVAAADALTHVLGVTAGCDTTAREVQQGDRTFARGKSLVRSCPIGPVIDLDPDWGNLEVVTRINGIERQRGHEKQLLWPIAEILAFVSNWIVLEAGDVILLGTPAGVGPLSPGDQLEVEVSGVGVLRNPVVAR